MRQWLVLVVAGLVAALSPARAQSARQSYIYATAAPYGCETGYPCPPGGLLVIDAATRAIVTRLPAGTGADGIAVSPDGRWLVAGSSVVDLSTHQVVGSAGTNDRKTIGHDSQRLFSLARGQFSVAVKVAALPAGTSLGQFCGNTDCLFPTLVKASPTAPRVFVTNSPILEYDATTLTRLSQFGSGPSTALAVDGTRVYAGTDLGIRVYDAATKTLLQTLQHPNASALEAGTQHKYIYSAGSGNVMVFDAATLNPASLLQVSLPGVTNVVPSEDESLIFAAVQTPLGTDGSGVSTMASGLMILSTASGAVLGSIPLDTTFHRGMVSPHLPPQPYGIVQLAATPAGAPRCSYRVGATQQIWTVAGGSATVPLTTGCSWMASSDAPWVRLSQTEGTTSAAITITVDPASSSGTRTATVNIAGQLITISQSGHGASAAPFGSFDTPIEGSTGHNGSVSVTGWALDETGVTGVRVYRAPVASEPPGAPIFIGHATIVQGARPDVAAIFPQLPFNDRAGWGLSLLTNMLPNQGNGTFTLYAYSDDVEGHTTLLGPRTFTSSNGNVAVPFGAIDTPGQGETVSGTIVNFGWALTPQPNVIPPDGSTIDVLIDGVVVGHPTYGQARADIAALFPGYQNSNAAVGYFLIDTTQYDNGIHTIAWVVRDNVGNAAGIGSRYFRIQN